MRINYSFNLQPCINRKLSSIKTHCIGTGSQKTLTDGNWPRNWLCDSDVMDARGLLTVIRRWSNDGYRINWHRVEKCMLAFAICARTCKVTGGWDVHVSHNAELYKAWRKLRKTRKQTLTSPALWLFEVRLSLAWSASAVIALTDHLEWPIIGHRTMSAWTVGRDGQDIVSDQCCFWMVRCQLPCVLFVFSHSVVLVINELVV